MWASTLAFFARGAIASQMSVDKDNNLYISGNVGTDFSGVQMMVVKYKDAVCAPLETDDFKQCDLPWGTTHYDHTTQTMCDKGCAVTALTTLNNFYKDKFNLTIASHTPLTMNQALIGLGSRGYNQYASVVWRAMRLLTSQQIVQGEFFTQDPRENGFVYDLNDPWTLDQLIQFATEDLQVGRPVIVRIAGASFFTHFMLSVSACDGKFQVSDPLGSRTEFDPRDPNTLLTGIRRFRKSP